MNDDDLKLAQINDLAEIFRLLSRDKLVIATSRNQINVAAAFWVYPSSRQGRASLRRLGRPPRKA
jgi:hypothetical protein